MKEPHQATTKFRASAFSGLFGALLVIFTPVNAYLHSPASRVDCPVSVVGRDQTSASRLTFSANPATYQSYSWQVSTGEIVGSRNGPSISVINVDTGSSCTATVTIRHNGCRNSDDHTTTVVPAQPNSPPTVSLSASSASITLPCPEGTTSPTCTASPGRSVDLTANAIDPDNDILLYSWSVAGGRVIGEGRAVVWDLSGAPPGTYTASVEVNDGSGQTVRESTTVTIADCTGCVPPCPNISVACPSDVDEGSPLTFTANRIADASLTFNWIVSGVTIKEGQHSPSLKVDTTGLGGQTVTAKVELGGLDPSCSRTASCTTKITARPKARKTYQLAGTSPGAERKRLMGYATQLQNEPGANGYIVVYGNKHSPNVRRRVSRIRKYLVNVLGIDAARLVVIYGEAQRPLMINLWIVPSGVAPPSANDAP